MVYLSQKLAAERKVLEAERAAAVAASAEVDAALDEAAEIEENLRKEVKAAFLIFLISFILLDHYEFDQP